jgi:hypothetical protein
MEESGLKSRPSRRRVNRYTQVQKPETFVGHGSLTQGNMMGRLPDELGLEGQAGTFAASLMDSSGSFRLQKPGNW